MLTAELAHWEQIPMNYDENTHNFLNENAFENVVCKNVGYFVPVVLC